MSSSDLPYEEVFITTMVQSTWQIYFDGAFQKSGAGTAGVIFVTLEEAIIPYTFTLTSAISNNAAEYEALIIGFDIAHNMGLNTIFACRDSQLVISQLLGVYAVKK